jgi:hypothetical protein
MLVVMVKTFENPKRKSHKVHMNKSPTKYLKKCVLKIKILRKILHFKITFDPSKVHKSYLAKDF